MLDGSTFPPAGTLYRFAADIIDRDGTRQTEHFVALDLQSAIRQAFRYCAHWHFFKRRTLLCVEPEWEAAYLPNATIISRQEYEQVLEVRLDELALLQRVDLRSTL